MEKTLIFSSANEVRFGRVLRFIIPTYLTSLFSTLYTIVDGIFVFPMWAPMLWLQSILYIPL